MTEHNADACSPAAGAGSSKLNLVYEAPELRCLGDLRDVTLGASSGAIESGATRTFRR